MITNFIIDFDSTFIKVEAFDELCKLCYDKEHERAIILEHVQAITDRGMSGEISINESLEMRLQLLSAHKKHIEPLIKVLETKVSESFKANRDFLKQNRETVFIVSNGFCEFILPIVIQYGILPQNVFANSFVFDEYENITGFDQDNILASAKGKVNLVSMLNLKGDIIVIGDGYTDYEVREAGVASSFYAFTENVTRANVVAKADHIATGFDTIIADFNTKKEQLFKLNNSLKKTV